MKISNLRIESVDGKAYLKADFECGFSKVDSLWFNVDERYSSWLTADVYDAFMVEAVFLGMYHHEDIEIDGYVSKKLHKNLIQYIIPVIKSMNPSYTVVNITVKGYRDCEKSCDNIVGTGFSGGVDSFSTIVDKFELEKDKEDRINTLFFFNVGQYPGKTHEDRLKRGLLYYNNSLMFAEEICLPYVFMDSNMFQLYLPEWEYDAGPMCRISSILVFQKSLTKYYLSGSNHYLQQNSSINKHLDDVTDAFIYYMMSPAGLEIILDGNQYYRSEKLHNIMPYEYVHRHLNVCVNSSINVLKEKNCSMCHKCLRTLSVLESLDALDDFKDVFNLEVYRKISYRYKCEMRLKYGKDAFSTENINFALAHGKSMPSLSQARYYLWSRKIYWGTRRLGGRVLRKLHLRK